MVEYKRKRKRASYSGRRSYTRKRQYIPSLGGGGYSGPRNYFRTHDFRYEREPASKPPKTETHHEIIERPSTEGYRFPAYRPEPDQTTIEKTVGRAVEKYLRNDIEQKQESRPDTGPKLETQPALQEEGIEANFVTETSLPIEEKAPENDLTQAAEPVVEISRESNAIIDKGAELNDTYELPVADLELLLIELDANPLEVQQEKNVEVEGAEQ
jgi:hypothetical protein